MKQASIIACSSDSGSDYSGSQFAWRTLLACRLETRLDACLRNPITPTSTEKSRRATHDCTRHADGILKAKMKAPKSRPLRGKLRRRRSEDRAGSGNQVQQDASS